MNSVGKMAVSMNHIENMDLWGLVDGFCLRFRVKFFAKVSDSVRFMSLALTASRDGSGTCGNRNVHTPVGID